jgi:hypothetical protein
VIGGKHVGEIVEIKLIPCEFNPGNGNFSRFVQPGKQRLVFFQDTVYPADRVIGLSQLFVVVCIAALVTAKFLIRPSMQCFTALKTCANGKHGG